MAAFKATFTQEGGGFTALFSGSGEAVRAQMSDVQKVTTADYTKLSNKPMIEGVTLQGDKSFKDLGLEEITKQDIDDILFGD